MIEKNYKSLSSQLISTSRNKYGSSQTWSTSNDHSTGKFSKQSFKRNFMWKASVLIWYLVYKERKVYCVFMSVCVWASTTNAALLYHKTIITLLAHFSDIFISILSSVPSIPTFSSSYNQSFLFYTDVWQTWNQLPLFFMYLKAYTYLFCHVHPFTSNSAITTWPIQVKIMTDLH
jgi:hypothetical protein